MDPQEEIPVILDDAAGGLIFGLFLPSGRHPLFYFMSGLLGKKGGYFLFKSAATVAMCSALFLALRQCYKKLHHQLPAPPTPSATPTISYPQGSAKSSPVKKKLRKMRVIPSPVQRPVETPDGFVTTTTTSSRSSKMASIKFQDTESDDDSYGGDVIHPEGNQIVYTPVVDEVATEADDESSEQEESEDGQKMAVSTGFVTSAPTVPQTDGAEDNPTQREISEFSLAFETDSNSDSFDPESELINIDKGLQSKNANGARVDPRGVAVTDVESKLEPRRVSLDELNASIEDGAVVTQAIVTIG